MESKVLLVILALPLLVHCIYPEHCNQEEDCEIDQVCRENLCICDLTEDLQYDEKHDICVKKSGAGCQSDEDYIFDCVQNAHCDDSTKICTCNPGYSSTTSKECKKSFGETCLGYECNYSRFLICDKVSNKCDCMDNETMTYDPVKKSCVSKLGKDCEFHDWMGFKKECVPNAICQQTQQSVDSNYSGICVCQNGFSNSSLDLCGKSYHEACQNHSECFTGFCQTTCDCPSKSIYDSNLEQCRIKAGQHCVKDQLCVDNAKCDLTDRQCQCESSTFFIVDGLCSMTPKAVVQENQTAEGNSNLQFPISTILFAWTVLCIINY